MDNARPPLRWHLCSDFPAPPKLFSVAPDLSAVFHQARIRKNDALPKDTKDARNCIREMSKPDPWIRSPRTTSAVSRIKHAGEFIA